MNEAQRQSYLKAMGLTPWVAHTPLPGAAPSPWLDWDEEEDTPPTPGSGATQNGNDRGAAPAPETVSPPRETTESAPSLKATLETPQQNRTPEVVPAAEPEAQVAAPGKGKGLVFTLEAHLGTGTWLLCAQEDSQAPGLGRFEAPLMASLLALFQGRPGRPRRFFCPLTDQPMQAAEAAQALSAFISGLCDQAGGERVLMALPEALNEALFDQPRYRPFEIAGHPALVISSLSEMLDDPATHKKASWQAMQANGFDGV
ncbi:MAG: hypothetical protein VX379_04655 [Pseudomonadota bacterium]|nr:hypothetical protein [Pseudomonadota bacterium]MEE3320343.1 hypothetical protein [Pseudomonadota bacterium]